MKSALRAFCCGGAAEEVGPGLYGDYCQPGIIGSAPQAPHDSHIAVHVASAAMHDSSDAGEQHIAIQTASAAMDEGAAPRDLQRRHQMDQQVRGAARLLAAAPRYPALPLTGLRCRSAAAQFIIVENLSFGIILVLK